MNNKKRLLRIISVLVLLVTIMGFGWSYFTDYKIQQLKAEGGVSLTLEKDKGVASVTQEGYKVSKNGVGWYKKGTNATVKSAVKAGYSLDGWYSGGSKVADMHTHTFAMNEPTVLMAKTKTISYTITGNLDGGTIDGKTTWSKQYTVEESVTLPTPVKKGHTFLGWVEDGTTSAPNINLVIPVGTTGNKTYTAKWGVNNYYADINGILDGDRRLSTDDMGMFDVYLNGEVYRKDARDISGGLPYGSVIEIKNIRTDEGRTYLGVESDLSLRFTIDVGNNVRNLRFKTNEYTLRYNVNGGVGTIPDVKFKHGTSVTTAGSGFTRDFYTLAKWNTVAGGTGTDVALGGKYSGYSGKDGDIVNLYAQWNKNTLTVVYYANGGTGYEHQTGDKLKTETSNFDSAYYSESGLSSFGGKTTFSSCKKLYFHPTDWFFVGSATSSKKVDSTKAYPKVTDLATDLGVLEQLKKGNTSVDLYAEWARNMLTINYHSNNATSVFSGALNSSGIGEGKDVIVATRVISCADTDAHLTNYLAPNEMYHMKRIGHTGLGSYANSADGATKISEDQVFTNYAALAKALGGNVDYSNGTIDVYPQWRPNKVNIRYHANGGVMDATAGKAFAINGSGYITRYGGMDFQYGEYNRLLANTNIGDLFSVKSTDYIFLNKTGYHNVIVEDWNTSSNGSGKSFDSEKPYKGQDITNLDNGDASVTLYANWKPNSYTVRYNANGGLGTMSDSSHVYDTAKTLSDNRFARAGYTFRCWTTNADGTGKSYNNLESVKNLTATLNGTVDLYAQWDKVGYNISYNLNGGSVTGNPTSYDVTTQDFTLRNPTKTGYTFTGWTGSNGTTPQTTVVIRKGTTGNLSYTANWKANNYTLSFNANGGTCYESSREVAYGSRYGTLPTPTRTGYSFKGWYTTSVGSTRVTENNVMGAGDVTIYAQWTPNNYTYNVVYKSSSGVSLGTSTVQGLFGTTVQVNPPSKTGYTAPSSQSVVFDSTAAKTLTFTYTPINYTISINYDGGSVATANKTSYNIETATFTLSQPTKTGYTFVGYTGTGLSSAMKSVSIVKGSTGNRSYTATWTPNKYTVIYNSNDGTGNTVSDTATYNTDYVTRANTFTRTGYTFAGWNTSASGGGTDWTAWIGKPWRWTYTNGVTLYAQWTPNNYTYNVNYVSTSGKSLGSTTISGTFGSSKTVSPPAKTGYTAPSSTVVTFDSTVAKTITFTYSPISYKITYTLNGGTVSGNPTTYTIESPAITLKNPTKTGYTFRGWIGSNGTSAQTTVMIPSGSYGAKNYEALYKVNTYTVTFDANGGTGSTTKTYTYGQALGTLPSASKTGYIFSGWIDFSDGSQWVETTPVTESVTLTALWSPITYTVRYHPNGGSGSVVSQTCTYGSYFSIKANTFTKPGYKFTKWNTNINGSGVFYSEGSTVRNLASEQDAIIDLYAQWEALPSYTVTLHGAGTWSDGTKIEGKTLTVPAGSTSYSINNITPQSGMTAPKFVYGSGDTTYVGDRLYYATLLDSLPNTKTVDAYVYYNESFQLANHNGGENNFNSAFKQRGLGSTTSVSSIVFGRSKSFPSGAIDMSRYATKTVAAEISGSTLRVTMVSPHATYKPFREYFQGMILPVDASYLFSGFESLQRLTIPSAMLRNENTSLMLGMFYNNPKLTTLSVSNLVNSKTTSLHGMIMNCKSLTSITGLDTWNTSGVTNMIGVFQDSSALPDSVLNGILNWDVRNVTTTHGMFSGTRFQNISLSNWSMNKIREMTAMFNGNTSLRTVSLPREMSTVTDMQNMFLDTVSLTSVSFKGTSHPNLKRLDGMFARSGIPYIDLSNLGCSPSQITNMFLECPNLTEIDMGGVNLTNVSRADGAFARAPKLVRIRTDYDCKALTYSHSMFAESKSLIGHSGVRYNAAKIDGSMANRQNGYFSNRVKSIKADIPQEEAQLESEQLVEEPVKNESIIKDLSQSFDKQVQEQEKPIEQPKDEQVSGIKLEEPQTEEPMKEENEATESQTSVADSQKSEADISKKGEKGVVE